MNPAASPNQAREPSRAATWPQPVALALGVVATIGLIAIYNHGLAVAATVLALLLLAVVRSPDLAAFAVIFVLYSNLAVVASRFHGVPEAVAFAFPLLLVVPLVRGVILRRQRLVFTATFPFLVLLLAAQVLSMAFSKNYAVTRSTVLEFLLEGLLLYFLITNAVRTPQALRLVMWSLLCAGFLSAIVPCYQQMTGTFDRDYGGFGQATETGFRTGEVTGQGDVKQVRLAGTIGEKNRYAQNMLMLLPLGLFLSLGERSKRLRLLAVLFTALSYLGFLLAFSRGGAVAFLVVLATLVAMRTVTARQLFMVLLVAALGLAVVPQYLTRLKTIGNVARLVEDRRNAAVDGAVKGRATEMLAAAMVFADHPVIGVGPGMFKYYSQEYGNRLGIRKLTETRKAHSLYLEVAAEGGVLGLICFFGVVLVTLYGLIVARRRLLGGPPGATPAEERDRRELANGVTGFLLALVAYLASALFLHLAYIRFFYLMLALAGAASGVALSRFPLPTRMPGPASRSMTVRRRWKEGRNARRL
jgi:hypothetical protein